jgi:hypothetical protein
MTAVGLIDKQTLPLEDAWYVEYYIIMNRATLSYHLVNRLKGVRPIYNKQQAQTPENIQQIIMSGYNK